MSLPINYPENPSNLISDAVRWLEAGHRIAMLTLVEIEGSAPYPVGTQMLVNETGDFIGQITGGCAEAALALQAIEAIKVAENSHQRYGLNSPFFDIRLPCGSGIDILFDVTTPLADYQVINEKLNNRRSVHISYPAPEGKLEKSFLPNERLIVCGQGPILVQLVALAQSAGFEVIALTHEQALKPIDGGIHYADLDANRRQMVEHCDEFTAFVSLFHDHDYETDLLMSVLGSPLFYIGALGSQKTHQHRVDLLRDAGVDESMLQRVHGPVGLDIGAQTPAQIAVSILAELIKYLPKRRAKRNG